MNELLEKFNEYKDISNYQIKYTLVDGTIINSKLHGDYIFFEKQKTQGYNYLSVAMDAKQNGYVESFFNSPTDIYIRNQQIVKVDKVEIYDKDGKLYLEDRLV